MTTDALCIIFAPSLEIYMFSYVAKGFKKIEGAWIYTTILVLYWLTSINYRFSIRSNETSTSPVKLLYQTVCFINSSILTTVKPRLDIRYIASQFFKELNLCATMIMVRSFCRVLILSTIFISVS